MKKVIIILCVLFFVRCKSENAITEIDSLFKSSYNLKSERSRISSNDINRPVQFIIMDSLLIGMEPFGSDRFLSIYNLYTGNLVNRALIQGRANNEVVMGVSSMESQGDSLYVFSPFSRKMIVFCKDQLTDTLPSVTVYNLTGTDNYFSLIPVNEKFVAINSVPVQDYQLALLGADFELISQQEPFPIIPDNNVSPQDKSMLFQGKIARMPDENKFIYYSSSIFKIFDLQKENINKTAEHILFYPKFSIHSDPSKGIYKVATSQENLQGIINIAVSNTKCFVLYSSKTEENNQYSSGTVYVFDWDGNPKHKLILDREVKKVVYSPLDNSLYALATNDDAEPEFIRFPLDGVI